MQEVMAKRKTNWSCGLKKKKKLKATSGWSLAEQSPQWPGM